MEPEKNQISQEMNEAGVAETPHRSIFVFIFALLALLLIFYVVFLFTRDYTKWTGVEDTFTPHQVNNQPAKEIILPGKVVKVGEDGTYIRLAYANGEIYSVGLAKGARPIDLLALTPQAKVVLKVNKAKETDEYDYLMTDLTVLNEQLTVEERITRAEQDWSN